MRPNPDARTGWRARSHPNGLSVVSTGPDHPPSEETHLIFITAKFAVRPEHAEAWPEISRAFTEATRAEDGCLWFDWSRSLDDPNEYVLVEAFRDGDAGGAHVGSEHFARATRELPPYLAATPRIVSQEVDQSDWSELGEMTVD